MQIPCVVTNIHVWGELCSYLVGARNIAKNPTVHNTAQQSIMLSIINGAIIETRPYLRALKIPKKQLPSPKLSTDMVVWFFLHEN